MNSRDTPLLVSRLSLSSWGNTLLRRAHVRIVKAVGIHVCGFITPATASMGHPYPHEQIEKIIIGHWSEEIVSTQRICVWSCGQRGLLASWGSVN